MPSGETTSLCKVLTNIAGTEEIKNRTNTSLLELPFILQYSFYPTSDLNLCVEDCLVLYFIFPYKIKAVIEMFSPLPTGRAKVCRRRPERSFAGHSPVGRAERLRV